MVEQTQTVQEPIVENVTTEPVVKEEMTVEQAKKTGAEGVFGHKYGDKVFVYSVGNFSKERVSQKQTAALVYLVNILRKYYKIPKDHIMGHGQVPQARTECPGKYFPWKTFETRLRASD